MLADITWDAGKIYAAPDPAARYTAWWSREYFGESEAPAESAYKQYFAQLDVPDKLWFASDTIQRWIDGLTRKVAGQTAPPLGAETLATLQARLGQLDDALAAETRAEAGMPLSEQPFFSVDVALGLRAAERQTAAALKLEEARAESPPFDRWYGESWIRSAVSPNNPHRAYAQLRAFIANEGRGQ